MAFEPDWTVHPGSLIRELVEEHGMTHAELAKRLKVSTRHVGAILSGRSLYSRALAARLEGVFGVSEQFWLNFKRNHKAALARGAKVT